jgi:hypothetical protein
MKIRMIPVLVYHAEIRSQSIQYQHGLTAQNMSVSSRMTRGMDRAK